MPNPAAEPSPRRRRSRQQLLTAIRAHNGITRSELSGLTGLSRSAVAEGVQALLAERLVTEHRMDPSLGRGRPSASLVPAPARGEVAGIDFGHSHVSVAVAQSSGRVLAEHRRTVDVDHQGTAALDTAAELLARCLTDADLAPADLIAVAAGIPGPLDMKTGLVRSPTILSAWVNLDPARELSTRLGRPVQVDNDANMGAQGELRFGAARGCRNFIYVKASHGIGAGLVVNGDTYRGTLGIAGEIGHTQLPDAHNWCRCGNRGCLEAVVSISEVNRQLAHVRLEPGAHESDLSLAATSSDHLAARVITGAGRTLGRVLADLCNALNPEAIILGGELGTAGAPLVLGVRESIDRYAQPAAAQDVSVRCAQLGLRSELMGAVATAIQHQPIPV
jgi:predicted NBD/HSP70 family sugar kinase